VYSKKREKPCSVDTLPQDQSALVVPIREFVVPQRTLSLEKESTPSPEKSVPSQGSSNKSERPPPIVFTSPVHLIFIQKVIKPTAKDQFSLRITRVRIRIVTYCMTDYKA
jgi:hypothetical protein